MKSKVEVLSDICTFAAGRASVTDLDLDTYISTENMLPNKEGIIRSSGLPTVSQTQAYNCGDVLVSNIRPYYKKIWFADRNGGCSNDVLVLRAKSGFHPGFLYYLLSDDNFFDYATATAKGTKMPRGDKAAIMQYGVPDLPLDIQIRISDTLSILDSRIAENKKINHHLEQMAQAIFKSWFIDFEPWGGVMPDNWRITTLGDVTTPIRTKVGNRTLSVFSAVTTGNLVLSDDYFTKQVYSKDIGKYIVVEPNDFSYNPARVNIGSIGINDFEFAGCVSPVYVVFRSELEYHHFLSFVIKTPNFQEEVRTRASGSVRQSMNYSDFALIETVYPSLDVIRDFNYQYEKIVEVIKQKEEESRKLSETRDALLPRLMSGELSVADV